MGLPPRNRRFRSHILSLMTTPPSLPYVAIYARISSDRTGQKAGVKRQLDDCRAIAKVHRLDVVAEVVENETLTGRATTTPLPGKQLGY